ncbi:SusC/RagA family TonB-linked outer membrane protein [Chitinophaga sedimenti]|uniref:SusC/RagA family TonB-linked outer membrane protein n=1 Tax=Chitinophaga sedimenti TaxID=2033606 RepID=UPI0027DF1BC0|nr:SusC/RagA family TonB-linked outer membrane protein [Chitinophaga sedimenti]
MGQINRPQVGSPFSYNDLFYDYSSFRTLSPFAYNIYNPDGSFGYSKWQLEQGSSYNVNNVVGRMSYYGYNRDFENNMNLVTSATQKLDFITKGLQLRGTLSYASSQTNSRNVNRDQFPSFMYDPATATYTSRDPNIYRIRRFFVNYSAGNTTRKLNLQGFLEYDRTFGEKHHVYGMALFNQSTNIAQNNNADYNYVPNNFRGLTARVGYDYKDKYLVQFNSAYNGSDLFVEGKRYGFFPAVSGGWNVSEEAFFEPLKKVVSHMKIRGSYGVVGNDRIGNFSYYYRQVYSSGNGAGGQTSFGYQHNGYTGVVEGTLPNFDISWEKERKADIGLELEFLKGKITFTGDYFNNRRYDIITNRGGISAIFGQSLPPTNFGIVSNKGYELELVGRGNFTKDFSFNVRGIYSFAKNKILEMDEPAALYPWLQQTGHSIGQISTYKWIGFYQDKADIDASPKPPVAARPGDLKYADLNGDGIINEFDKSYTEYPNLPNTTYGFQLGLNYKSLSFMVLFRGSANFNVRGVSESIRRFRPTCKTCTVTHGRLNWATMPATRC